MNIFLKQEIADNYDNFYDTTPGKKLDFLEKQAIEKLLPAKFNGQILELGCGTGHWSSFLSEKGYNVTSLDISEAMLSIARSKNITNVTFSNGDAASLPFNNASFSLVVSITMLEFTDDIRKVINEIYRILKPGGLLILGCLNLNSQTGKTKDSDETFRNAHFFTKEELLELFQFFGDIQISESVYLTPSFEILDGTMENYPVEGAFLAVKIQKNKQ